MSAQLVEKAGSSTLFTRWAEDPHDEEFILEEKSRGICKRIVESQNI